MGFLQFLGLKPAVSAKALRDMLPATHSFVDVAARGGGPKGSICFEQAGQRTFATTALAGMATGQTYTFLYSNESGRFRFHAALASTDGKRATFGMPGRIETVQKFGGAAKRKTVRMDTTVAMTWRYPKIGKIDSPWQKASVSDVSRSGCSITLDKPLKIGEKIELALPLRANGADVSVVAQAMRVDAIATSKKSSVGLKFVGIAADAEAAIVEFINRRQTDLRNRGLG